MGEAGMAVEEIRATGGFTRSPFWRQLLADALHRPVTYPEADHGSAFGAALLGLQGVGLVEPGVAALEGVISGDPGDHSSGEVRRPGPDAAVLERRAPLLDRLPDDLADVLAALDDQP
jgi:gluconokinase